jgi:tol-pal system protein YbgF
LSQCLRQGTLKIQKSALKSLRLRRSLSAGVAEACELKDGDTSHNLDVGYSNVVGHLRTPVGRAPMTRIAAGFVALPVVGYLALFAAPTALAQASASDVMIRLDQLESQMRQLTGTIEQLQYRNQQLEQAMRRMQEDTELRFQQLGGKGAPTAGPVRSSPPAVASAEPASVQQSQVPVQQSQVPVQQPSVPAQQPGVPGRRSDAFDPTQNPNAPGVPRTLGTIANTGSPPPVSVAPGGVPGPRPIGVPLDLSTVAGGAANEQQPANGNVAGSDGGLLPPPPPRNTSATTGQLAAVQPPSQSPRDEYDLAYGYLLRKDYALAEDSFRTFLRMYPSDRLAADAQFWLGESLFQRQSYRDAADAFLTISKKYETSSKAPDALLRLGQSLAAMGQKELACATFGEVGVKYPRASLNVKQSVEREQKRVHC